MKDQLRLHKACIDNITARINIERQITEYKELKHLILNDPLNVKVSFWKLSDVEKRINSEESLLESYKSTYKDMLRLLKSSNNG